MQYICNFIFKEQLGIDFKFTIDSEGFKNYYGPQINYSNKRITDDEFFIECHPLLYENNIRLQTIDCFTTDNNTAFFKTTHSDFAFDIFAASFFLISRYEEYLPHEKDIYGRYAHKNSLAYKQGFLHLPLVNIWIKNFANTLKSKFPDLHLTASVFNYSPTYDIDIAYSYKHKGFVRNLGGFIKSPSVERIKVLSGTLNDPFDCYQWLNNLHKRYHLHPIYFFLVAQKNGLYDKNILPHKTAMWKLVKQHAIKYSIGLHPSWQSGDNSLLLKKEKEQLIAMMQTNESVSLPSRQHYIRFSLPEGYETLLAAGILEDYSMGYGSINGFRASVASSFYWYNLAKDESTKLRLHPFCFMDANSFYEQQQTPQQTFDELLHYLNVCKENHGTLITIWHNNFLGTAKMFKGWKEIYEKFISQVPK